jgi:hypothetical protein
MQLTCLKECYISTPNALAHVFVNNMADTDISDYEFDADNLLQETEIFNKEIGEKNPGIMHGLHSW